MHRTYGTNKKDLFDCRSNQISFEQIDRLSPPKTYHLEEDIEATVGAEDQLMLMRWFNTWQTAQSNRFGFVRKSVCKDGRRRYENKLVY